MGLASFHSQRHSFSGPSDASLPSFIPVGGDTAAAIPSPSSLQTLSNKRAATSQAVARDSPAKRQSKWTPEEDALNVELRGGGMKWDEISKRLPGRSAISCRLRYQNYIERRTEWDEEKKNKLARLYARFKDQMWEKVAKEMGIPWRAAEAMHWQLGEHDMAQRANAPIFHLSSSFVTVTQPTSGASPLPVTTLSAARHLQLPTLSDLPRPVPSPMMVPTSTTLTAPTSALASRSRRSSNTSSRRRPEPGNSGPHSRYQQYGEGRVSPSPSGDRSHISNKPSRDEGSAAPHGDGSFMVYESSNVPETSGAEDSADRTDAPTKADD